MQLFKYIKLGLILIFFFAITACKKTTSEPQGSSACAPCGVGCAPLTFTPDIPSDVNLINQLCANTLAWQSFIALTWPADPNNPGEPNPNKKVGDWGKPGDYTPMTFETYASVEDIFTNHAPGPWGANHASLMGSHETDECNRRLQILHKFHPGNGRDVVEEFTQAGGNNLWLTDQEGNLIWYEIKVNKKEFEFITTNKLYDPKEQIAKSENGGIWLPENSVELKASWRIIPDDQLEALSTRYKIIKACVPTKVNEDEMDLATGQPTVSDFEKKYLGLVGLHIIQKTPKAPQFFWATFEHNDLAPVDNGEVDEAVDYLLYNKDTPDAKYNQKTKLGEPIDKPTQTKKEHTALPLPSVTALNEWVQKTLKEKNPNSVFLNYRLANAQWPSSSVKQAENITPLPDGGKTPLIATNVSMETYIQNFSCLGCHVYGSISVNGLTKKEKEKYQKYSTDYSFIFQRAIPQTKDLEKEISYLRKLK